MRHRCHRGKLSRPTGHRKALIRNLAISLVEFERIRTTEAKAKVLRPFIERLITLGKKASTHHRRMAFAALQNKTAVHKIFETLAPRFAERPGGYTRIIHDGQRQGDGSWMAYLELVDRTEAAAAGGADDVKVTTVE